MIFNFYEQIADFLSYEEINEWKIPNLDFFSNSKSLYKYQKDALKNVAKILHYYFTVDSGKDYIHSIIKENDIKIPNLGIKNNINLNQLLIDNESKRFNLMKDFYDVENEEIEAKNFLNRMAFWMATGSGKSIVIIKLIEYLSYLQDNEIIPKKNILILLPRNDLINQFQKEVSDYNKMKTDKHIRMVNLKSYEKEVNENKLDLFNEITIYYYRSDLLRDENKESIVDFKDYENNGDWYLILDEAHRGETGVSLLQDYVSIMSRNGFLFNFSATFVDNIDFLTTVFNFNLERFINAGYGKKIFLSNSEFELDSENNELNNTDKQKQVLKSLLTYTVIKKSKTSNLYHTPLLVTLVNSINTNDSDLLIFFKKLEEIANGTINSKLLEVAKLELIKDLENKSFLIGNDNLRVNVDLINSINIAELLKLTFNSNTHGKIEILEGEKGKELLLKLETSENPFGLIKIGDADKFQREKLGNGYRFVSGYYNKNYFNTLNSNENINLLLGSRSFYEGWDSNRPNVINFINIGGQNAKKYVLQALGRGIRIEPQKNHRKRLKKGDKDKNVLLETLFVYATDKKGINTVIETVKEEKSIREVEVNLEANTSKFDLLIPVFENSDLRNEVTYFSASEQNKLNFIKYFNTFEPHTLITKKNITLNQYNILKEKLRNNELFQISESLHYNDYNFLLDEVIEHIKYKNQKVRTLKTIEDEIVNFEHVKLVLDVDNLLINNEEIDRFFESIDIVKQHEEIDLSKIAEELKLEPDKIVSKLQELQDNLKHSKERTFKELNIIKFTNHYYNPLIYSNVEKVDYIKNIITVESEVQFLKSLINYTDSKEFLFNWMFSSLNEKTDKIFIPYFSRQLNKERKFFPDFIFWLNQGEKYKIIFIDPKGTAHSDYISKLEEFERIFTTDGKPNIYKYKDYLVEFDIKMITDDINSVPLNYQKYWSTLDDFNWFDI